MSVCGRLGEKQLFPVKSEYLHRVTHQDCGRAGAVIRKSGGSPELSHEAVYAGVCVRGSNSVTGENLGRQNTDAKTLSFTMHEPEYRR